VAVPRVGCCELSPWHIHRSQLNRRVPVTSFQCRPTYTGTTALDTPTLLPQAAISAALFSAHHALAIFLEVMEVENWGQCPRFPPRGIML